MSNDKYSDEFKADAVNLYETHQEHSYKQAAINLGISHATLKRWVRQARQAAGTAPTHPEGEGIVETTEEELRRLRVENADLIERTKRQRTEIDRLAEERTFLRKATKYFAAETTR